jgi:malate dehydrogenase (oxaloacetate-decarboxylating)
MAGKVESPIIFPLSNPFDRAEAVPGDLIRWTDGRALIATGTEFPPVALEDRTIKIAQCNNFYIFPAIGLAIRASEAKRVTDRMMVAAAEALGNISQDSANNTATELLPPIDNMRDVAIQIAVKVGLQAQQDGVAQIMSEQDLRKRVQQRFWIPQYLSYQLIRKGSSSK